MVGVEMTAASLYVIQPACMDCVPLRTTATAQVDGQEQPAIYLSASHVVSTDAVLHNICVCVTQDGGEETAQNISVILSV